VIRPSRNDELGVGSDLHHLLEVLDPEVDSTVLVDLGLRNVSKRAGDFSSDHSLDDDSSSSGDVASLGDGGSESSSLGERGVGVERIVVRGRERVLGGSGGKHGVGSFVESGSVSVGGDGRRDGREGRSRRREGRSCWRVRRFLNRSVSTRWLSSSRESSQSHSLPERHVVWDSSEHSVPDVSSSSDGSSSRRVIGGRRLSEESALNLGESDPTLLLGFLDRSGSHSKSELRDLVVGRGGVVHIGIVVHEGSVVRLDLPRLLVVVGRRNGEPIGVDHGCRDGLRREIRVS